MVSLNFFISISISLWRKRSVLCPPLEGAGSQAPAGATHLSPIGRSVVVLLNPATPRTRWRDVSGVTGEREVWMDAPCAALHCATCGLWGSRVGQGSLVHVGERRRGPVKYNTQATVARMVNKVNAGSPLAAYTSFGIGC